MRYKVTIDDKVFETNNRRKASLLFQYAAQMDRKDRRYDIKIVDAKEDIWAMCRSKKTFFSDPE